MSQSRVRIQTLPCGLNARLQITPLRRMMFVMNTTAVLHIPLMWQILKSNSLVAGAWTERKKIFHGGSFLKLADDNMDIQNPEAQNRELSGF